MAGESIVTAVSGAIGTISLFHRRGHAYLGSVIVHVAPVHLTGDHFRGHGHSVRQEPIQLMYLRTSSWIPRARTRHAWLLVFRFRISCSERVLGKSIRKPLLAI